MRQHDNATVVCRRKRFSDQTGFERIPMTAYRSSVTIESPQLH
jgi:hypothetical protein